MIVRNGNELSARYRGSRGIAKVYYGSLLVWEAAATCIAGIWRDDLAFLNEKPFLNKPA